MVEDGRAKMSRPIFETQYRSSAKYAVASHEVPPTFRDFDETVLGDPTELIRTLQEGASRITGIVSGLKREGESLADAYTRVGEELDGEYNYTRTRQARQFLPLMPAGTVHEYSIGLYFAVESEVAAKRAKFWRAEHPDSPNPFGEVQKLFESGFLPKGFRVVEGEEHFVIDIPMRAPSEQRENDASIILGCWSNGDERIEYFHMVVDDCEYNMNLDFGKGKNISGLGEFSEFGEPGEVDIATNLT